MHTLNRWRRLGLTCLLGLFMAGITLFILWSHAQAGVIAGGAGNCGNFADAVALAEDGDVIVQMLPARNSEGAVIKKNLRISGGWLPTENCEEQNQFFTETADYLAYGFTYGAPYSRSELVNDLDGSVLILEDPADPNFPNLDNLIIEHIILARGFGLAPSYGGGMSGVISDGAHILLDNVWFRDNYAFVDGGGLHLEVRGGSHLVIEESAFYGNTADNEGGALYVELREGSRLTLDHSNVMSNQSVFAGGLHVTVYDTSELLIRNSDIRANQTTSVNAHGGGARIFMYGGRVTIENTRFEGNAAGDNDGLGGGLYLRMDGGEVTIKNSVFSHNTAGLSSKGGGGGLYVESVGSAPAAVTLINTRFEQNSPNPYEVSQIGSGPLNLTILDQTVYLPAVQHNATPSAASARITDITLDENFNFVVAFETQNFIPALPGVHVHFFFDTVAPEDAGVPGSGPWKVYGGSSPFTGYHFADRPFGPDGAEKLCVLVANPDHSIRPNTGNCVKLP